MNVIKRPFVSCTRRYFKPDDGPVCNSTKQDSFLGNIAPSPACRTPHAARRRAMVSTRRSTLGMSMPAAASALAGAASALLARADADGRVDDAGAGAAAPPLRRRSSRRHSSSSAASVASAPAAPAADVVDLTRGEAPVSAAAPPPRAGRHAALPNLALLCAAGSVAVLMLGIVLQLGVVTAGLVSPAWGTFRALERRPGAAPLERWAAFWVLAAALFAADRLALSSVLGSVLPGPMYAAGLFSALAWLGRDDAANASRVYAGGVAPLLLRYEGAIEGAVCGVAERVDDASRYGLVKVADCIRPIAEQLEHAADRAQVAAQEKERRIGARRDSLERLGLD